MIDGRSFGTLAFAASLFLLACAQQGLAAAPLSPGARQQSPAGSLADRATPAASVLAPTPSASPSGGLAGLAARPLRLPVLAPGQPCPIRAGAQVLPAFGLALGDGPVYSLGLGADAVLEYVRIGVFAGSPWGGQKVLWVGAPAYRGPVLIRGRQLDGSGELRFGDGIEPPTQLAFPAGDRGTAYSADAPDWRNWPSYTRVRAPGCYAYQVDGADFTEVISFVARVDSNG